MCDGLIRVMVFRPDCALDPDILLVAFMAFMAFALLPTELSTPYLTS